MRRASTWLPYEKRTDLTTGILEAIKSPEFIERFFFRVMPQPGDGCWLWMGGRHRSGYGAAYLLGQHRAAVASRVAYAIEHGTLSDSMFICHRCDNRLCVRPSHLFLGTPADNTADMVRKGRNRRGPRRKGLPREIVERLRQYRKEGDRITDLAMFFAIPEHVANGIATGKTYRKYA